MGRTKRAVDFGGLGEGTSSKGNVVLVWLGIGGLGAEGWGGHWSALRGCWHAWSSVKMQPFLKGDTFMPGGDLELGNHSALVNAETTGDVGGLYTPPPHGFPL